MQQGGGQRTAAGQAERSSRSVFVGNISYDATEQQLRQIFSQAGPVAHFRLMVDHDTGRPKGYGFCEYVDPQAAERAIRTLNGYELNNRTLRVDSASGGGGGGERGGSGAWEQRDQGSPGQPGLGIGVAGGAGEHSPGHPSPLQPHTESPYGPEPEPGKAPEAIAKAVASMPPERMYELMRQMKESVNNNPQMARHLLTENPQLAYALLQAQVIMRVVDPTVAYQMLLRETPALANPLLPFHQAPEAGGGGGQPPLAAVPPVAAAAVGGIPGAGGLMTVAPPVLQPQQQGGAGGIMMPPMSMPPPAVVPTSSFFSNNPPPPLGLAMPGGFPGFTRPPMAGPQPHIQPQPAPATGQPPAVVAAGGNTMAAAPTQQDGGGGTAKGSASDDEQQQAAMLVKVLQLTDEQIRLLPPEDRAKVIELRNQLRATVPGT